MNKKEYDGLNMLELLIRPFMKQNKMIRLIIGILVLLIIVLPFFSVSNGYEAVASLFCTIILILLSYSRGKTGKCLWGIWSALLIINLITTSIIGAPFGGMLTTEIVEQKKEEKFLNGFAEALYKLSVRDYENSLDSFKKIKNFVPDKYLLEYYLWYIETASYSKNNELSTSLRNEVTSRITNYNAQERDILFKWLPIGQMISYLNEQKYNELEGISKQYQNTNEQIFHLFELVSICFRNDISAHENRIKELIVQYPNIEDTLKEPIEAKLELMAISAALLVEEYPEYTTLLLSQIFKENKSYFFETFLFYYPDSNNYFNARWFSLDNMKKLKAIYEEGWKILNENNFELFEDYQTTVEELGYYLGSTELLKHTLNMDKEDLSLDIIPNTWELYNIIPLSDNNYLGVLLEPMENDMNIKDLPQIATIAHFYIFNITDGVLSFNPILIDGEELCRFVSMHKLFLIEHTQKENVFLVESIQGTGEYLYLELLDINNKTIKSLKCNEDMYHTSWFQFDGKDSYITNFEIGNSIDANATTKVGGIITGKIDFIKNIVDIETNYSDPSIEFYVEERNDALIFPLENLNCLNGKEIKNETLLKKIRENSIPYYKYSMLQQSYDYLMKITQCKFSGITIIYDAESDHESSFFYFVKREGENIELLGIYEIIDNVLHSVY